MAIETRTGDTRRGDVFDVQRDIVAPSSHGLERLIPPVRPPWRSWTIYTIGWSIAGLLYAFIILAMRYTTPAYALATGMIWAGSGGVLGVGAWWASGRLPFPRHRRIVFFLLHTALAVVYAAAWTGIYWLWLYLAAGPFTAAEVFVQAGVWIYIQGLMTYAALAGTSYVGRTRRRLREEQATSAQAQAAAAHARFVALRAQLNPHFLFNALHALRTLVKHDPDLAVQAIEDLGALLRYALDEGAGDSVLLADEWQFTETYLSVERRRLGERLRVDAALSPTALACSVPPFLVQPLVENAVRHGIGGRPGKGTVRVRASVEDELLTVEVSDDGVGSDLTALDVGRGVGLRALREQIHTRYDGRARLTLRTAPGEGFTARVQLPATTLSQAAENDE